MVADAEMWGAGRSRRSMHAFPSNSRRSTHATPSNCKYLRPEQPRPAGPSILAIPGVAHPPACSVRARVACATPACRFKADDEAVARKVEAKNELENYAYSVRNTARCAAQMTRLAQLSGGG
jgi:hypothetical protein